MSTQGGLCGLTNPLVTGESSFEGLFLSGQRLTFSLLFMSQQGLGRLTNLFVTWESSFGAYFSVGSNSVFLDCL